MRKVDAIKFYGSKSAVAGAAGVSPAAVSQWGELVPKGSAAVLAAKSNGKLVFDPSAYSGAAGASADREPAV